MKPIISHKELKRIFSYEKRTGLLRYRRRLRGGKISKDVVAGYLDKKTGLRRIYVKGRGYPAAYLIWYWHHGVYPDRIKFVTKPHSNSKIENLQAVNQPKKKTCSVPECQKTYPATLQYFGKESRYNADGLTSHCRDCGRRKAKEKRDRLREEKIKLRQSNPPPLDPLTAEQIRSTICQKELPFWRCPKYDKLCTDHLTGDFTPHKSCPNNVSQQMFAA